MSWLDDAWASLFSRQPSGAPGTAAPAGGGGGLLDPRGAREQALYASLGQVGAGLLASGAGGRPLSQPNPLYQTLAAFAPTYSTALQGNLQSMRAEQQLAQQQEQEQRWQAALAAASPAERALMQQMGREQWGQMQGQVEAARRTPSRPQLVMGQNGEMVVFDPDAHRRGTQPGTAPPVGGPPQTPGGAQPGRAQAAGDLPSSGNPVIDATLNQIRPAESGNNPAAVPRGPDGQPLLDRNGQPLAGGLYQFTVPTWQGVAARHPELQLSPDGRFDAVQSHRAAQAHAQDILRDLGSYIGRRGPNGEIITGDMLIRGAWAGGVEGVRRYIESGGRRNPADAFGTTIGGYFTGTAPNLRRAQGGGSAGGGAQATPPAPAEAAPVAPAPTLDRGRQAPPAATPPPVAARPPTAAAPPQPSIPGVTVLRQGQRPVGELVAVQGPNGPVLMPREQAVGQTPGRSPPPPPDLFARANTLRDEYNQGSRTFEAVQDAYENIRRAASSQSGAGDMAFLYSFVRMLDPTSVVRESEFATAAASGSLGERMQTLVGRVISGERLPESLRQSFLQEASNIHQTHQRAQELRDSEYTRLARSFDIDPANVVIQRRRDMPPSAPATGQGGAAQPPAAAQPAALPPGIPAGSTQVGTRNGNPVYQTPDGRRLEVQP